MTGALMTDAPPLPTRRSHNFQSKVLKFRLVLWVPTESVGKIMSRRGILAAMHEDSQISRVSSNRPQDENSKDLWAPISIFGEPAGVDRAYHAIMGLVRDEVDDSVADFYVHPRTLSSLVGPNGQNVKRISAETNVRIYIPGMLNKGEENSSGTGKYAAPLGNIQLEGAPDRVFHAFSMIMETVRKYDTPFISRYSNDRHFGGTNDQKVSSGSINQPAKTSQSDSQRDVQQAIQEESDSERAKRGEINLPILEPIKSDANSSPFNIEKTVIIPNHKVKPILVLTSSMHRSTIRCIQRITGVSVIIQKAASREVKKLKNDIISNPSTGALKKETAIEEPSVSEEDGLQQVQDVNGTVLKVKDSDVVDDKLVLGPLPKDPVKVVIAGDSVAVELTVKALQDIIDNKYIREVINDLRAATSQSTHQFNPRPHFQRFSSARQNQNEDLSAKNRRSNEGQNKKGPMSGQGNVVIPKLSSPNSQIHGPRIDSSSRNPKKNKGNKNKSKSRATEQPPANTEDGKADTVL